VVYSGMHKIPLKLNLAGSFVLLFELRKKLIPLIGNPNYIFIQLGEKQTKKTYKNLDKNISTYSALRTLFDEGFFKFYNQSIGVIDNAVLTQVGLNLSPQVTARMTLDFSLIYNLKL